jgi:hypothetical protein
LVIRMVKKVTFMDFRRTSSSKMTESNDSSLAIKGFTSVHLFCKQEALFPSPSYNVHTPLQGVLLKKRGKTHKKRTKRLYLDLLHPVSLELRSSLSPSLAIALQIPLLEPVTTLRGPQRDILQADYNP